MEIIPVIYAHSYLPEDQIFIRGDKSKIRPIIFQVYLIKSDGRTILVDAGCETMPGFDMKNFIGTVKALKNTGTEVSDITDVIITHAHHDHIECVKYFSKAVIHIQKEEFSVGKKYIPDSFKVNTFDDEFSVCDNVKVIKIGGHSQGSCVVEIENNGKIYVIAGDECYLRECLDKKIPTGNSYNLENSRNFIEKYSTENYVVFLCHDE